MRSFGDSTLASSETSILPDMVSFDCKSWQSDCSETSILPDMVRFLGRATDRGFNAGESKTSILLAMVSLLGRPTADRRYEFQNTEVQTLPATGLARHQDGSGIMAKGVGTGVDDTNTAYIYKSAN